MKENYIAWVKSKKGILYNLASSGVKGLPLNLLSDQMHSVFESGEHEEGWPALIETIAQRYHVSAEHITLAPGATMANHLALASCAKPGGNVLIESPGYEPLEALARYLNLEIRYFDRSVRSSYQPDPEEIKRKTDQQTCAIILTDLHNPSGMLLDEHVLAAITQLAETQHFFVLIDEVYLEFLHHTGMFTRAGSPQIITTRSITKAFGMDDVRMGWIVSSREKTAQLHRLRDLFMTTMPFPSERLAKMVLEKADPFLAEIIPALQNRREIVDTFIQNEPSLCWIQPSSGTVGFVQCSHPNLNNLYDLLEQRYRTLVAPGRFFGDTSSFRIGWAIPEPELRQGLENLHHALNEV